MSPEKRCRVAIIGCVHDHVWRHIAALRQQPAVDIVAVAEESAPLRGRAMVESGAAREYTDYEDMLSRETVDAVVACMENYRHADLTRACTSRGIHLFVDKPMAATLAQAKEMIAAQEASGVKVMIDYPTAWNPGIRYAYQLVQEGCVGDVIQVHHRTANGGPKEMGCSDEFCNWLFDPVKNGGGALIDYGCYGAKVCRWFMGVPESVTAVAANCARPYMVVEDNAVLLLKYPKAIGIAEASWSQMGYHPRSGPHILGTEGAIYVDSMNQHGTRGSIGWRGVIKSVNVLMRGYSEWLPLPPPAMPVGSRNGIEYFINAVMNDSPIEVPCSLSFNLDVQAILEAGLISAREGRAVALPL